MSTPRDLLERYVEAKDFTRPALMPQIYRPEAVLTYDIATDAIRFPARTEGIEAITRTLITDFALQFRDCRTYYVCEAPSGDAQTVAVVPWLVVMREVDTGNLRVGRGYYRWTFQVEGSAGKRVSAMHIHIDRMDRIDDPNGQIRQAVQSVLPYPWLPAAILRREMEGLSLRATALAFLRDFALPVQIGSAAG